MPFSALVNAVLALVGLSPAVGVSIGAGRRAKAQHQALWVPDWEGKCADAEGVHDVGNEEECRTEAEMNNDIFYMYRSDEPRCATFSSCNSKVKADLPTAKWKIFRKNVEPQAVSLLRTNGTATDTADQSLCFNGKLLPMLYVLGVQKSGTTSLAYKLMQGGVETALKGDVPDGKEWHFFDRRMEGGEAASEDAVGSLRGQWLANLPDCQPTDKAKRMVADFTIINLMMVPLPDYNAPTGTHWGWWWRRSHEAAKKDVDGPVHLPRLLRWLYPAEARQKLRFAIMLREPLARMQSAWYHARAGGWQGVCRDCHAESFQDAVGLAIDAFTQRPAEVKDWLWTSMYERQLRVWLDHFSPKQFYLSLFQDFSRTGEVAACRDLSSWVGFETNCAVEDSAAEAHKNTNSHAPLSQDITPELKARFDEAIEPENERLVRLLTRGQVRGMRLVGFNGKNGAEADVRAWLMNGW